MIHHAQAETAEDIARLLRTRGRIVITAPPRSGKTTELIRYAEERYPNGRFAVVCKNEDVGKYIIRLHWCLYNGITVSQVVAARLLGKELEGGDVNEPMIVHIDRLHVPRNESIPYFVDCWESLSEFQKLTIMRRKLFIAAVAKGEPYASQEDQNGEES